MTHRPHPTVGEPSAQAGKLGSYYRLSFWLALCALFSLSLLIYGTHRQSRADLLFLAGVAVTTAFAVPALLAMRRGLREEQAREAADERFRVLFEHSSDAHLLFDDTGIIDCNNAAVQMLRCKDKAEVLTLHPAELSPEFQPDGRRSLEKCVEMDARARTQGMHRFEWMHRKMDGELFPVEVTLTPVIVAGKDTLLVVWHDLTERKRAEEALRQSHDRMAALIEAIPDAIYQVSREGICLDSNSSNKSHSLTPNIDLIGKPLMNYVPPHVGALVQSAMAAALATRTMQSLQYQVDIQGKTHYRDTRVVAQSDDVALIVARDVTDSKVMEMKLRKSQESLNHAQAMAHVGSWERDYRNGTMAWSDELFRLCGLEPGAITPDIDALTAFTHPLDRKRAHACMQQAMQSGKGAEIELRLVGADGVLRYVFIRTEILTDDSGQPIGSRGAAADVTERVKALQEQTKFVSLIENSSDFIAMASLDGALLAMNPAGRKLVGLERVEEVATTLLQDFLPAEVWNTVRQDVLPTVMRNDRWEGKSQLVHVATGKVHDTQASFFLIRNPVSGEPMCLATVQRDITEQNWLDAQLQHYLVVVQEQNVELELQRRELAVANADLADANKRLEMLATTDGLTGAKNHRALQEKLEEEFKRARRTQHHFSVILLDVDQFKQYNDLYGHPEGDQVLQRVVSVLKAEARETDCIARSGGEEFVVLLPDTGRKGALEAAERFRAAIEAQDWPLRPVTASFGIATLCATIKTGKELIECADRALYAGKAAGRNRVVHADAIPAAA